jgi:hypothetical protein
MLKDWNFDLKKFQRSAKRSEGAPVTETKLGRRSSAFLSLSAKPLNFLLDLPKLKGDQRLQSEASG